MQPQGSGVVELTGALSVRSVRVSDVLIGGCVVDPVELLDVGELKRA